MEKIKNRVKYPLASLRSNLSGKFNSNTRNRIVAITTTTLVVLFIIFLVGLVVYYQGKAAPGTTIANANIGGQNSQQIAATINSLTRNMRFSLTYKGKSVTANSEDFGINIDASNFARRAIVINQINPIEILFKRQHFKLTGTYDPDKVKAFVTKNFPELTTEPVDAQLIYQPEQSRYIVKPGAIGKSVDLDKLYNQIEKMLANPQLTSYEIATVDSQPTVSDQNANKTANDINNVLANVIQITNNGRVIWSIDPSTIASWTSFTVVPDKKGLNSYQIDFNRDKIRYFVDHSVSSQLPNRPINEKVIANMNGETIKLISPGQNGQLPNNQSAVVNQIFNHLTNATSGQVDLTTAESTFQTDKTTAPNNRWIEYNVSTFTATLYDGTNPVWSTNQTSTGKNTTPTITGLYKVWHKVFEQCMPNPPSPKPLCNIHYITYWERSGYAFHEAWWMSHQAGNVRGRISHGCVNMFLGDAKRVYEWAEIGTPVWVHW